MSLGVLLAPSLDPALLMQRIGRPADPWQAEVLRSNAPRIAMLKARQVGGSEVLSVAALHQAAYRRDQVVGIVAPTLRQSTKLLRRARRLLPSTPHVVATNNASTSLTLSNGSSLQAFPGSRPDLIRGDVLHLLICDESAWIADETMHVTLPMLAMTGGRALLASSPGGPSGFMFNLWQHADGAETDSAGADVEELEDWHRIVVRATDCPRYTPASLARLRRELGEASYAVELLCEWRTGADSVWSADEIRRILGFDEVPDVLPGEDPLPDDESLPSLPPMASLSSLLAQVTADRINPDRSNPGG